VLVGTNPSAEAKFLKEPPVLFHGVAAVVKAWAVPGAEAVAPVLTVQPVGRPDAILSKFSVYGEVLNVTWEYPLKAIRMRLAHNKPAYNFLIVH
jgi:hypothetical protein